MEGINNNITLGVGHISFESYLGKYYQDIAPSMIHITDGVFACLDSNGIPYFKHGDSRSYAPITIIQYGLANYDTYLNTMNKEAINKVIACIEWLILKQEEFHDSFVIRLKADKQYQLDDNWISGMVQAQYISLLLRVFEFSGEEKYLIIAQKVFNSFKYLFEEGGFRKYDNDGCLWFEEYNTKEPSFVLNGFIYTMFGILDYYRVTKSTEAKSLWDECVITLEKSLHKYHKWYWSVYDQQKKQLVSYYYQKNVHIPLMEIMFALTGKNVFNKYAILWRRSLNNPIHRFATQIMYRVQPRLNNLKNKLL